MAFVVDIFDHENKDHFEILSSWYLKEWGISRERLNLFMAKEHGRVIEHYMLFQNEELIAAGGLFKKVGIHDFYPDYAKYGPWVGLVYVEPFWRNQGLASKIMDRIELKAKERNDENIFLHTNSAVKLYERRGYVKHSVIDYHKQDYHIMSKKLISE
ncbi:MAG: GNAT family N-acetyltransferase [Flavobacteriales bacterium]|nr:GNAT family N-acetyltransferase [Flavobacteriales bacterium]